MKFFLLILLVCNVSLLNAQQSTKSIFEQTINKINTLKSVSYTLNSINGNIFSKDDITTRKSKVSAIFNDGMIDYKLREVFGNKGNKVYSEIYRDKKLYTFDITDSIYSVDEPKRISDDLSDFARLLKETLEKHPNKIIRKADTTYQHAVCYSFFIKVYDTVSNGQHDFTHKYVLINKKNFLPVNLKQKGEGTASKGGHVIGRVFINDEEIYADIEVNPKIVPKTISFAGFRLKNTEMLLVGAESPQLKLKTLAGEPVDEKLFNNKVLLVVFGSIDCPANPLANPVLNRLYAKYKDVNLAILDIFTSESGEQVRKYIEANNLHFPTYLATKKQHSDFKIISTPNFYVVGIDGKIKSAIEGYSGKLENDLIKSIDEQLANQ